MNIEELKETVFRKGFPKEIADHVAEKAKAGEVDITEEHYGVIGGDEMGFRLHFRADQEQSEAYLNAYTAALLDHPGGVREHTFSSSSLITNAEAHRMLKYGKLVAVNKDLFNKERKKYNAWLSIDVEGAKDEQGNYPVISFHENYFKKRPLDIGDAISRIAVPVQPLRPPFNPDYLEKDFKKAHLVEVIITVGGEDRQGFLALNPGERRIDVYDKDLNLVEAESLGQKASRQQAAEDTGGQAAENNTQQPTGQQQPAAPGDEKKKSWAQRPPVKTPQNKGQHKGIR